MADQPKQDKQDKTEKPSEPTAEAPTATSDVPPAPEPQTPVITPPVKRQKHPVPEGFMTLVDFAKYIGRELIPGGDDNTVRPQIVYGFARNSTGANAFPWKQHTDGRFIVNVEEGKAWWIAKEGRKQEREAKKAALAAAQQAAMEAQAQAQATAQAAQQNAQQAAATS